MAHAVVDLDAAARAAEAIALVQAAPHQARQLAHAARDQARIERDLGAEAAAERALGLAARELREIAPALRHLRRAVSLATRAGDTRCAAESRMSLALALSYAGRTSAAVRTLSSAGRDLRGADAGRLQMQQALVLQRLGAWTEALRGYGRALRSIRRAKDRLWEARLLNNRGLLRAYRNDSRGAEADLRRAQQLYEELGQEAAAMDVEHNLGFVAARRGDFPTAFERFDRVDEFLRAHRLPRALFLVDRCEALLAVGLAVEARAVAEQATAELVGSGMESDLAEARLMLAEAALAAGDAAEAAAEASRARLAFVRQRRHAWTALAEYVALRASWEGGERTPALRQAARRVAANLAERGWDVAALDARILAGRVALELGRVGDARAELAEASSARRRGSVLARVRAWEAEAHLRLVDGNRLGAYAALRAGLRVVDDHRATLGATELRAHAAANGAALAVAGLRLALSEGDARRVLAWSERWRAAALLLRPVRPPEDVALAADLAELRQVTADIEQAARGGEETRRLERRQLAVEEAIRARQRRSAGGGPTTPRKEPLICGSDLGGRRLVEYFRLDGRLYAVTLTSSRARLHAVGEAAVVERELELLRHSLRRSAFRLGGERALAAAETATLHASSRLDELLVRPLEGEIGDCPLVLVPTGPLHALPWATLPSLRGRDVALAPSAALWRRAQAGPDAPSADGVALVAGPGLPAAHEEVMALARLYERPTVLVGAEAGAAATLRAIDGAALAHVAAHGTFRAGNALFSSLRLADGPLTVYDLETLATPPRTLVLSACDAGLSDVRPGDELMGLASALLASGTASVIASVTPVPDDATAALMVELHAKLCAGVAPAAALAEAQASPHDGAAGFVCLGAG